ncbi:MAG TPA: type II secretion system F family protein [Clostridiales bacterium]|nr:MAG: Bacterial type II secretion system protein F domain protein [Firmicutes bacterium ADurb.Bin262]HOU11013.1 type II secretion system F family protein [Clostridiales bacterium]HQK74090.1 type II secretion system F family protein [Clostridiales bacterium]
MTGLRISVILLTISVGLLCFFGIVAGYAVATANRRRMKERIRLIQPEEVSVIVEAGEEKKKVKRQKKSFSILHNKKLLDIVQDELLLANIMMRAEEFLVVWLIVVFIPSGLSALFLKNAMPSITLAVVGAVVPLLIIRQKKKKRLIAFESQLSDALVIVCNCLRSGLSLQQGFESIAREMQDPINREFTRLLNEVRYGNSLERALDSMADRIQSADLFLVVSAINVQRQTGGNLSEILGTISQTIKDRIKIKSDIRTMTAQGRITGMVIGGLPIVLGAFLFIVNPSYMEFFFKERMGNIMIITAVILEFVGFSLIKKIISVKY